MQKNLVLPHPLRHTATRPRLNQSDDSDLGALQHTVLYRTPFFVNVGSLILLLSLLGTEFKHASRARTIRLQSTVNSRDRPLKTISKWLIASAVILVLSALLTTSWIMDNPHVLRSDMRRKSDVLVAYLQLAAQVLCFPLMVLTVIAASGLKHRHYRRLATLTCILLMIPWTPAWFLRCRWRRIACQCCSAPI